MRIKHNFIEGVVNVKHANKFINTAVFCLCAAVFALCLGTAVLAAEVQFKRYTFGTSSDKNFAFGVEYPDIYGEYDDPYVDGDGVAHFGGNSNGGKYAFGVEGMKKPKGATGESLYKEATNMEEDENGYVYGVEPIPESAEYTDDFYSFDYLDDSAGPEEISHVYCSVGKNVVVKYWIRYPKGEAVKYAEITARMTESIELK
jgi:hypothetical protein